jgi:type I restriction enzyme R subunit
LEAISTDVSLLPDNVLQETALQASIQLGLSPNLAAAEPAQLTQMIRDFAPHMKNRRSRPSAFLNIDLPDFIAARGTISVGAGGQQVYVEEYRRRIEARILDIVANHPALEAIRQGIDSRALGRGSSSNRTGIAWHARRVRAHPRSIRQGPHRPAAGQGSGLRVVGLGRDCADAGGSRKSDQRSSA